METENIECLLEDSSVETTEVLFGLEPGESVEKLEAFIGEDGRVLKNLGFDIYRVRLTVKCLECFVEMEPSWVTYVEHAGDGVVSLYQTENLEV